MGQREETLGMLAAVDAWVKRDHEAEWKKSLTVMVNADLAQLPPLLLRCSSGGIGGPGPLGL